MSKTAYYIGNFRYPHGNAAGKRVAAVGELLEALDYDMVFIGFGDRVEAEEHGDSSTTNVSGKPHVFSFPYPSGVLSWMDFWSPLINVISIFRQKPPDLVILYGSLSNVLFVFGIITWCSRTGTRVVHDCVDWLSVDSGGVFFRVIKGADQFLLKRFANKLGAGNICVSKFLSNYYGGSGPTVTIPPLSMQSTLQFEVPAKGDGPIRLVYAGQPFPLGRQVGQSAIKDRLDLIVEAVCLANQKAPKFELDIYGVEQSQFEAVFVECDCSNYTQLGVHFHGRVSMDEAGNAVANADYTVLVRDDTTASNAGFPTKVVESVELGIPVIANPTSDMELYLGDTGFLKEVENPDVPSIMYTLHKVSREKDSISCSGSLSIDNPFYFLRYGERLKGFLDEL